MGEEGRIEVMLHVEHRPPIEITQAPDAIDRAFIRQCQLKAHSLTRNKFSRINDFRSCAAPLIARHGMEMAALQRVINNPRWRNKPTTTHLPVDQTLSFQLAQRLAQGDSRGGELVTQLAL